MNSNRRNDLPKAVRSIIQDSNLIQTETSSMKINEPCRADYVNRLCDKIETLKEQKKDRVAYGDILQIFTNSTDEYAAVFSALENLDTALSALTRKMDESDIPSDDFIAHIMHKELINNINNEIHGMSLMLKKSSFFKPLLDQQTWRYQLKEKIQEIPLERKRVMTLPNPKIVENKQTTPRHPYNDAIKKSIAETVPADINKSEHDLLSVEYKDMNNNGLDLKKWKKNSLITPVSNKSDINDKRDRSAVR